jgi:ferredoxin-NADP reductase
MVRHRSAVGADVPARLLVSARTAADLLYWGELQTLAAAGDGFELNATLTRERSDDWRGYDRRVDADMLREIGWPPADAPRVFVCGPTSFVEAVAESLVALGHRPALVKTERFGPTGG